MPSTYPLFISYRRSDLSLEAEWLANLVRTFFGDDSVFFDREEIASGTRWDDTLRTCIRSARVILVLIGPNWLKAQGPSGMRRLRRPAKQRLKLTAIQMCRFTRNDHRRSTWVRLTSR